MSEGSADLLAIVEAAYRLEVADDEWLRGVALAALPVLGAGFGLCAFEFKYSENSGPTPLQKTMVGMPPDLQAVYPTVFAKMDPEIRKRALTLGPCTTGSQIMGVRRKFQDNPLMQMYAQKFGIYDSIWISAAEPSGWGCALHAGRPRIGWAPRGMVERWSRIAGHLSA